MSTVESLYKQKWAEVEFDSDKNAIVVHWDGFVSIEQFKETMLKALDAFYEKGALHWLIDQTNRQAVHPTINEWVIEQFYPLLIDAAKPKSRMAVVVSKDVFGRFSMRNQTDGLVSKYEGKMIPYKYFKSVAEAAEWLENLH
jgi:hypothetical protein